MNRIITLVVGCLVLSASAIEVEAKHDRKKKEREIRNKYHNRVAFGGQYNALQLIPIAVDIYFTGGEVTKEWALNEAKRAGIRAAELIKKNGFDPDTDVLIGDIMTFRIWEFDRKFGYNVFVPYLAIKREGDKATPSDRVPGDGVVVSFENKARKGKYLDIDGKKVIKKEYAPLMPLQSYSDFGGCDWVLEDLGNGFYAVRNMFSGLYLDVSGKKFGEVKCKPYSKFKGCDWKLVSVGDGYYKLVNRYWSEKRKEEIVLDIVGDTNMPKVEPFTKFGGCEWKLKRR